MRSLGESSRANCCGFVWRVDSQNYSWNRTSHLIDWASPSLCKYRKWVIYRAADWMSAAINKMSVEQTRASGWRTGLKSIFYPWDIQRNPEPQHSTMISRPFSRHPLPLNTTAAYGTSYYTPIRKPWKDGIKTFCRKQQDLAHVRPLLKIASLSTLVSSTTWQYRLLYRRFVAYSTET